MSRFETANITLTPSLKIKCGVLFLMMLFSAWQGFAGSTSFFNDHAQGWHWYQVLDLPFEKEQKDTTKENKKDAEKENAPPSKLKKKTPTDMVIAYKKELENRLHQAWIHPTPENVKAYQILQKDMMDRSQLFSKRWMQNVYTTPLLDNTLKDPVHQKAVHLANDLEKKRVHDTIKNLSKEYGLFFFFSGGCDYCHGFAPSVKHFSNTYGWDVLAISLDGGSLSEFPDAVPDNGLAATWHVEVLPSLYAVNPRTEHVIPLAHGMVSVEEMETRLMKLVEPKS